MLLITMHENFGASAEAIRRGPPHQKEEIRHRGFVTALPLNRAIERIHAYQAAYNERYSNVTSISFELLQVSVIPPMSKRLIEMSGAVHVEALKQSVGEFD